MDLLNKLFEKKGIKNEAELTNEEKITYDNYRRILNKEVLEVADIQHFLESQIDLIETKWRSYESKLSDKAELIPYHTVYKSLLQAIRSPMAEREALEVFLNQQINAIK